MKKLQTLVMIAMMLIGGSAFAQEFQKVYPFDQYMQITDVYPTDSCYYYIACHGTTLYTDSEVAFGKLDLNGNVVFQNTFLQQDTANFPNRTYAELQLNHKGNFVTTHITVKSMSGWYPRVLEIDPNGNLVNDFMMESQVPDSMSMGDQGLLIYNSQDTTYDIVYGYYTRNVETNPIGPLRGYGTIWMKIDQYGDTLWTKRYDTPGAAQNEHRYLPAAFVSINDSTNLLVNREYYYAGSIWASDENWSKMHFLWLDKNGNVLDSKYMEHTPVCYGGNSLIPLPDGTFIYEYDDSFLTPYNSTTDVFEYIPLVGRLDQNLDAIWKAKMNQKAVPNFGAAGMTEKLLLDSDTSFVYGYGRGLFEDTTDNSLGISYVASMVRRSITGDLKWSRNFLFYPDTLIDTQYPAYYTIKDIELTDDGGYIMVGDVDCFDSVAAQVPWEFGYVVKTNCLGFIGSPQAGIQYQNLGQMNVEFVNKSTEAGSFELHPGNGDIIHFEEDQDTIIYNYLTFGPHNAMLVAHGCDGETDTVFFEVNPVFHTDPTPITVGQGYFSLFPNPIIAGNYLYIYLNNVDPSNGDLEMFFYSSDGKLVSSKKMNATEGNHLIHWQVGGGVYHAILFQGDKMLQSRKFEAY